MTSRKTFNFPCHTPFTCVSIKNCQFGIFKTKNAGDSIYKSSEVQGIISFRIFQQQYTI